MADFIFSAGATNFMNTNCPMCGETHRLYMTEGDYTAWKVERHFVQDVFPHLTADVREVAISGTCPECWKRMCEAFSEEDDYDDADDLEYEADQDNPFAE